MDLKRAWRNGFLAPLLLAAPLYDLSLGEIKYLIADSNAQKQFASLATGVSVGTSLADSNDDADPNRLMIPEHVLTALLGSGQPTIDDSRDAAVQFDPQDIFDSAEGSGDGFQELTDNVPRIADARLGSGTPLSIGFATPFAANGSHSPHSAALFTAGGDSGSGGGSGNSADDFAATQLSDPSSEDQTQSENSSPQSVPEPSSLVLLAIGAIAVALLVQRNSRIPTRS